VSARLRVALAVPAEWSGRRRLVAAAVLVGVWAWSVPVLVEAACGA
jgi:hypothetical protein